MLPVSTSTSTSAFAFASARPGASMAGRHLSPGSSAVSAAAGAASDAPVHAMEDAGAGSAQASANIACLCRLALHADNAGAVPAGETLFMLWRDGPEQVRAETAATALDLFQRRYGMRPAAQHVDHTDLFIEELTPREARGLARRSELDAAVPSHFLYLVRSAAQSADDRAVMQAIDRIFLAAPEQKLRAIVDDNTRTDQRNGNRNIDKFWDDLRFVQTEEINAFGKLQNQQHVRIMTCINIDLAHEKARIAELAAADDRPMLVPIMSDWHWRLAVLYERGARGVLYDSRLEPDQRLGFARSRPVDAQVRGWFDQAHFHRHVHEQLQEQIADSCGLMVCDMMERIVQAYPSRGGRLPLAAIISMGMRAQKASVEAAPREFNRSMRLRLIEPFLDARDSAGGRAAAQGLLPADVHQGIVRLRGALARLRASQLAASGRRQGVQGAAE